MKVGDLVKIYDKGHESYKGLFGMIIDRTKSAWMERVRVDWFDGRSHWHDPRSLEVINESR